MDINLSTTQATLLIIAALWEIAWKGIALWKASQNRHLNWFIALMVINSIGILPIIYILFVDRSNDHGSN